MTVGPYLRTKDLARAAGISVQQVRNYEAHGLIPMAERSPSGYRRFTRQHLVALETARRLMAGYGVAPAQQIMRLAHQGQLAQALALIDERHAALAGARRQLEQTLAALRALAAHLPAEPHPHVGHLRAGAAARLVGVRVSALRFWEQQGLLQPARERSSRYRLYDERQLRRLRIVALLRQAHYRFDAIRMALEELEAGQPQRAIEAAERRRGELAKASWRCLEAMAAFHAYASEFLGGQVL
ncbi:MAG: MerR family DNA-binding transcriptional regulator [Chloroflexota bacterium]